MRDGRERRGRRRAYGTPLIHRYGGRNVVPGDPEVWELRSRLAAGAKEEYEPICWDVMRRRYLTLMEEIIGTRGQTAELSCASKATRLPG